MSKRNYSQYSKKNEAPVEEVAAEAVTPVEEIAEVTEPAIVVENAAPEIKIVEETVETVAVPETVKGIVTGCTKLNVRKAAKLNAEPVEIIEAGAIVEIDPEKCTKDWFKVRTASGVEGFCMKKFINTKL